jgi:filamentous hemagglutinin
VVTTSDEVDPALWTQRLQITTGANQVGTDTTQAVPLGAPPITPITPIGPAPSFAIDVAELGGMYAGHIFLVGTEAGVGVRNAGEIGASAGEVVISANGWLDQRGRISSAGATRIEVAGGISNSGTIYASGSASLKTSAPSEHSGTIAAAVPRWPAAPAASRPAPSRSPPASMPQDS